MRHILSIVLILVLPILVKAQENHDTDGTIGSSHTSSLFSANTAFNNSLIPFNAAVSTGVSFGNLYSGNYFQSFIAPTIGFPVNKKLSITTGITYSHTNFNNVPSLDFGTGTFRKISGELNTLSMSAAGLYRVNDKLHFTGSVYKTLNPSFNARLNPESLQMEAKGMSVGIGYRLSENTFIGAEFRMEQGNSNFYNPYNNHFNQNNNSLFNRGAYFPGFSPF